MTDFNSMLALLSASAYLEGRSASDVVMIPGGVDQLPGSLGYVSNTDSGFEASAFLYDGQIVISYAGTTDWRDAVADAALAGGIASSQLEEAALFYEQVKAWAIAEYGAGYADNIVFTGHSLGGGIAALMGLFFDKPAVTFDPAPFRLSATTEVARDLRHYIWKHGQYVDSDLATYTVTTRPLGEEVPELPVALTVLHPVLGAFVAFRPYPTSIPRKSNVTAIWTEGEILTAGIGDLSASILERLRIHGAVQAVQHGGQGSLGGGRSEAEALHSINLLAVLLATPDLQQRSLELPTLLKTLVDGSLGDAPVLVRLLNNHYSLRDPLNPSLGSNDTLDRFDSDLEQLVGNAGVAQTTAGIRDALVLAATEYYYFKDATQASHLFSMAGGGLHFQYSDIGAPQYQSLPLLADAVAALLTPDEQTWATDLVSRNAWHIQSGTDPLLWVAGASDLQNDAAIGGNGNDSMDAGAGNDIIIGGAGNDILSGGAGLDTLFGGAGNDTLDGGTNVDWLIGGGGHDTYNFSGDWGSDVILEDSVFDGVVQIDGVQITGEGAKRVGTSNFWETDDGAIKYTVVQVDQSRTDLIITFTGVSHGTITIRDWSAGRLGISLGSEAAQDPANTVYAGDFIKATSGGSYELSPTGYVSAGALPDSADVINGTSSNDTIRGLGGNDGLAGGDGDDLIEGGAGADLILGGFGVDTINGGDGDDHIFGSASGLIDRPTSTTFTPPASSGVEIARGFSWVIYNPPGVDEHGADSYVIAGVTNILPNGETVGNVIDGGTGNDWIYAGTGDDIVHGGTEDDSIWGMGQSDVLFGDAGNDAIFGDGSPWLDGAYTPPGEHGDDILHGGDGNDTLVGQGGNDQLFGGADDDQLFGDDSDLVRTPASLHGNDDLYGGSGNDTLVGSGGDDVLAGGSGNDTLIGDLSSLDVAYHGADWLYGDSGNDTLYGNGGADHLFGGDDDDVLYGDTVDVPGDKQGDDYLEGGAGADTLIGAGGADRLYGGEGADQLFGDADNVAEAYHGKDILDGGAGDDQLQGYGGDDTLIGGSGNDTLYGDQGNDTLSGGAGSDTYYWGTGSGQDLIDNTDASGPKTDTLWIGSGLAPQDLVFARNGNDLVVRMRAGSDTVTVLNHFAGAAIDQVLFEDGTLWDTSAITAHLSNELTAGNDVYRFGRGSRRVARARCAPRARRRLRGPMTRSSLRPNLRPVKGTAARAGCSDAARR